jgi:hypothetical protein
MIITAEILSRLQVCVGSRLDFAKHLPPETELSDVIDRLISEKRFDWANALVTKLMTSDLKTQYEIYAAEQVIYIYKKKYPDDERIQNVLNAAKTGIFNGYSYKAAMKLATEERATPTRCAALSAAYAGSMSPESSAATAFMAADADGHPEIKDTILRYGVGLLKQSEV